MAFSALDFRAWHPAYVTAHPLYVAGQAYGWRAKTMKTASSEQLLTGRLHISKSGFLLLSVPNALVRGIFDALSAPGAELPTQAVLNVPKGTAGTLNAHIVVMTPAEVQKIGEANISERGHSFAYALGGLTELPARKIAGVSKLWAIQVASPALTALRKSYGLAPKPADGFYITVAVRRTNVLKPDATSKTAVADKLPGGAADHVADDKFPAAKLRKGVNHELEHTTDRQIAKEIAKDHLSEEPGYYDEDKEKDAQAVAPERSSVLRRLLEAKSHSDAKRYDKKNAIVRELMQQDPQAWKIDDPKPHHKGVTHQPTKFKLHVDPTVIPTEVKAAQSTGSVYANQFWRSLTDRRKPITYDHSKPVFENIRNQLAQVKRRGDFILEAQRNNQIYRAGLDPRYRYQLALQAFRGELPQASFADRMINLYGDQMLGPLYSKGLS